MRGVGRAQGAVSFVNALATGVGCAAAVALPVEARVELHRPPAGEHGGLAIDSRADSPLVRAVLLAALRKFAPDRDYSVRLEVDSRVPQARGLKSSSAVSTAVTSAVAQAVGVKVEPEVIAGLSAEVSLDIGLSATGAFDDAMATFDGGAVVADNRQRRVLRHQVLDPDWTVALWVPPQPHAPSRDLASRFAARSAEGRAAADAALRGDFRTAVVRNTELVERLMGYSYRPLREELRRKGALAAGVSGMGPTLAAIVPRREITPVLSAFPKGEGEVAALEFVPRTSEGLR